VISEPERLAASTMTTPSESPEINRLRRGKSRARFPAERHFGNCGAGGQNVVEELRMLGRIDAILAAGEHRDRSGRETCRVRGRIDAARQPRDDRETGFAELARDPLGEFQSRA